MRELVSTIRKLEKALIQKSGKMVRESTGAREDWEEEIQRRSGEVKEGGRGRGRGRGRGGEGEMVSEGTMSIEREKQLICSSAAWTVVQ